MRKCAVLHSNASGGLTIHSKYKLIFSFRAHSMYLREGCRSGSAKVHNKETSNGNRINILSKMNTNSDKNVN